MSATSRAAVTAVTGFMSEVGGEEFKSEVGDMMVPERNGKSAYVGKEAAAGRPPRRSTLALGEVCQRKYCATDMRSLGDGGDWERSTRYWISPERNATSVYVGKRAP